MYPVVLLTLPLCAGPQAGADAGSLATRSASDLIGKFGPTGGTRGFAPLDFGRPRDLGPSVGPARPGPSPREYNVEMAIREAKQLEALAELAWKAWDAYQTAKCLVDPSCLVKEAVKRALTPTPIDPSDTIHGPGLPGWNTEVGRRIGKEQERVTRNVVHEREQARKQTEANTFEGKLGKVKAIQEGIKRGNPSQDVTYHDPILENARQQALINEIKSHGAPPGNGTAASTAKSRPGVLSPAASPERRATTPTGPRPSEKVGGPSGVRGEPAAKEVRDPGGQPPREGSIRLAR